MRSRADVVPTRQSVATDRIAARVRVIERVMYAVGLVSLALLAWRLFVRPAVAPLAVEVSATGELNAGVGAILSEPRDLLAVTLHGVPSARTRAMLRAVRGSGVPVRLYRDEGALPALAVTAEAEWKASGGTRLQFVGTDDVATSISDGAGLLDSSRIDSAGLRSRTGPVQGLLRFAATTSRAAAHVDAPASPELARVLVVGSATWESRFLVAALEEASWPVDVALSLAPRVTITQGGGGLPSRTRHAIVVVLPGASEAAVSAVPAFARAGGGVVIVGEAARVPALRSVLPGAPDVTMVGELGAEGSAEPRHGLELVPIVSLAPESVVLESRDGRIAVAARRVSTGRVVQVGYDNTWLWRMSGNDDAPRAHRQWWSTLLSGIVPVRAALKPEMIRTVSDTLDAAPLASLARDLSLPQGKRASLGTMRESAVLRALDLRWLLAVALLSFVASWLMRRWRGLP